MACTEGKGGLDGGRKWLGWRAKARDVSFQEPRRKTGHGAGVKHDPRSAEYLEMRDGRDLGDDRAPTERIALNLAPFAAAAGLAAVVALVATTVDWAQYAVALGIGILAGLIRLAPSRGVLDSAREVFPSLVFLTAVAFLRSSAGGANSGVAVVALLPVFWTALHGDRRQLCVVTVGVAVFFLAPPLLVGAPAYPSSQYRASVLFLAVSAIIGFTTQWLVAEVRFQANEAEHREQALERVAAVMRGLSNSAHARVEVCEAARSIASASFALLFEPGETAGSLRSTAMVGLDIGPLEIAPDQTTATGGAFASRRAFLWNDGDYPGAIDRGLWETVGRPTSILFEPVFRGEEAVGVLVVGWPGAVRAGGTRATLITLLAHEVAATIKRADLLLQLTDMASTDALTGLPNRRAWDTKLSQAVLGEERFVLAMLDLDHFKDFNDTQGHPAGDRLLKETAAAWREELRAGDFLARIGGEEFALLLPPCATDDALMVIERLRERVPYDQTCSAGVVVRDDESPDALMARADEALYRAKAAGRDRALLAG
ncbi:MAG: sensor domain-containing diguanylate cyclase [Solirubrobacteraceae bacterium]